MRIPLLDLKAEYQTVKEEVLEAIREVLEGMTLYMGPNVRRFEEEFAAYIGVRHAVGMSSGTDAILLALMALGVKPGDRVIVPSHTYFASVAPLIFLGAAPIFADIDPATYNLDPGLLDGLLNEQTKGIIVVHLYGQSVDMDPVREFARRNGLWVIEDACQGAGAEYKGRKLGSLGDVGCFSFVYTKNLKAYGDSGMVTTNDPEIARTVRFLSDHGRSEKYRHEVPGMNARLGEMEAAVLRIQLKHLDSRNEARKRHADYLNSLLGASGVLTPLERDYGRHVYHQYVIRAGNRDALASHLARMGVETGIHYPIPCHLQPACSAHMPPPGSLPKTEQIAGEILSLPVYPELSRDQLDYIGRAVADFYNGPSRTAAGNGVD